MFVVFDAIALLFRRRWRIVVCEKLFRSNFVKKFIPRWQKGRAFDMTKGLEGGKKGRQKGVLDQDRTDHGRKDRGNDQGRENDQNQDTHGRRNDHSIKNE